jgi:phosphate-selective porin OprO/OprP
MKSLKWNHLAHAPFFVLSILAVSAPRAEVLEPSSDRLEIKSKDGANRLRLIGRLFYDVGDFDSDVTKLDANNQVESARLGLSGTVAHDFNFLLQYELANAFRGDAPQAELKDAWIAYSGLKSWDFRIGQFQEPFSLEELTSSRYITFMERALPNAFVPGYHLGASVSYQGKNWQATGGYFDRSIGPGSDDEGWGYAARVTAAPIHSKKRLLHLGASAAYRNPDDDTVRFRARPETGLTDERLVSTGTLTRVEDYTTEGIEAAWIHGSFSLQGEYMLNQVERSSGRDDASFQGGYVYASWFITGESRVYSEKRGVFSRIKPKKRYGAVEVALRYSMLDLNDGTVEGGTERNWTLGGNWYINKSMRLMTNAIWVNSERRGVEDDPSILQARLQYDF